MNGLINFVFRMTGIPWVTTFISTQLAKRKHFKCAALATQWLSLSIVGWLIWMGVGYLVAGETLKGVNLCLGALLTFAKTFDATLDSYRQLKFSAE
ncbi:hypothetical protein [Pseudomonas sp. DCB_BG]|uniref:hypothetical protein n=1 Tax=Pseudomonas sp. DCB_BG TaxID=2993595 RepID=UPI002248831A|nr:hypothetical protein [Pseudomonas sp. DCB_BG]MCX2706088.1 hypothetical protein [Pseudomonas sp. DCB_BG]